MSSTNYTNSFIVVSPDYGALAGQAPKVQSSIAALQYEMITSAPYKWTSDDVIFGVFAARHAILPADMEDSRKAFFSRGQPCLRTSPLVKTHGWGVHHDDKGRIALFGVESLAYEELSRREGIKQLVGMRSRRA